MKRIYHLLIATSAIMLTVASCTKAEYGSTKEVDTKSAVNISTAKTSEFDVTPKDVEWYMKLRVIPARKDVQIKEIVPLTVDREESHIYLVNMKDNKGWYLIAGDMRMDPVIAMYDDGNIDAGRLTTIASLWLSNINREISKVSKRAAKAEDKQSTSYAKWECVRRMAELTAATKADDDILSLEVIIDTISRVYYDPFTETSWTEGSPWNQLMPLTSSGSRVIVPSTALAIGQYLYYMHYHGYGPSSSYENGTCTSLYTSQPYNYTFSNSTTSAWGKMSKVSGDENSNPNLSSFITSVLLGHITHSLGIKYVLPDYYSGTFSNTIVTYLAGLGVSTAAVTSENYVNVELSNDRPVILSGVLSSNIHPYTCLIDGRDSCRLQYIDIITYADGSTSQNSYGDWTETKLRINTGSTPNKVWSNDYYFSFTDNSKVFFRLINQ